MSAWPQDFERAAVLGAIEEATGTALRVDDPLPDSLIARAQELGLDAVQLRIWIHDQPKLDWSKEALARWAQAHGFLHEEAAPHAYVSGVVEETPDLVCTVEVKPD